MMTIIEYDSNTIISIAANRHHHSLQIQKLAGESQAARSGQPVPPVELALCIFGVR